MSITLQMPVILRMSCKQQCEHYSFRHGVFNKAETCSVLSLIALLSFIDPFLDGCLHKNTLNYRVLQCMSHVLAMRSTMEMLVFLQLISCQNPCEHHGFRHKVPKNMEIIVFRACGC